MAQTSDPAGVPPVAIDLRLSYVIERARITQPSAVRRLNAFENVIALHAQRWRPFGALNPAAEIRMSGRTSETLCSWIEAREHGESVVAKRLAVYRSEPVRGDEIADGWVRLVLTGVASRAAWVP